MASERYDHEGHSIEVRERKDRPALLIDGKVVRYGRLPSGQYFLDDYAYDWTDDLVELARRYISHKSRGEKIRCERGSAQRNK